MAHNESRQAHRDERPRSTGQQEDHQRPEEVEVLLDGERPEVVDVGEGPLTVLGDVDVDGVEPRPGLALDEVVERRPPQQRDQRGHEEEERQHAVVEREDAQEAPHVKVAEVMRLVTGVVEDAGDEEAGQDEEQVDAVGPVARHEDDGALDPVGRQHVADEVDQQDHQDGQAPHPVEHRQVSMQVGQRAGTRRPRAPDVATPPELDGVDRGEHWRPGCGTSPVHRGRTVPISQADVFTLLGGSQWSSQLSRGEQTPPTCFTNFTA